VIPSGRYRWILSSFSLKEVRSGADEVSLVPQSLQNLESSEMSDWQFGQIIAAP